MYLAVPEGCAVGLVGVEARGLLSLEERAAWFRTVGIDLNHPAFVPVETEEGDVRVVNRAQVQEALETEYPPLLREIGSEGTVFIGVRIARDGDVMEIALARSSGHPELDDAAQRVARTMRFTPFDPGPCVTSLWMALPIIFQVRSSPPPVREDPVTTQPRGNHAVSRL